VALPEDESLLVFTCVVDCGADCVVAGFAGVLGVGVEDVTEESANEALLGTIKQTTISQKTTAAVPPIARIILALIPTRFGIVFRIQQKAGLACP
jgi:hypothetical protein